jgi:hypothetical protein
MWEDMHGKFTELTDEKEIIRTGREFFVRHVLGNDRFEPLCIIHFYHSNFRRCEF